MDEQQNSSACQPSGDSTASAVTPRNLPNEERRHLLTAIGGVGVTVLAGCLGDSESDVASYTVVFFDQDGQTEVEISEDEKLLYPALDAGVDIPYACEVGRCGQCTGKYDGNANEVVTHDGNQFLDEDQIAEGWLLTCVAYPRADFELEVAHPDTE
jgi:ferredoxin